MTVGELIDKLSKYPLDMTVSSVNTVFENMSGEVSLIYRDTPEEAEKREQNRIDALRRHQEDFDRRGEITSFANRW